MMSQGTENLGKMKEHFGSAVHQSAVIDMAVYENLENSIKNVFDERNKALKRHQEKELTENQQGIMFLIEILNTLGKEQTALCSMADDSDGNFCQILNLVACCNPQFSSSMHERTMKGNTVNYLNGVLQNQFFEVLGNEIKHITVMYVKNSGAYSIIEDTTPDCAHEKSLVIVSGMLTGMAPSRRNFQP